MSYIRATKHKLLYLILAVNMAITVEYLQLIKFYQSFLYAIMSIRGEFYVHFIHV